MPYFWHLSSPLGCPTLHLHEVGSNVLIMHIGGRKEGGLEIFRLRHFFWFILTLWSLIGQMGSFVTWFRCKVGHPNLHYRSGYSKCKKVKKSCLHLFQIWPPWPTNRHKVSNYMFLTYTHILIQKYQVELVRITLLLPLQATPRSMRIEIHPTVPDHLGGVSAKISENASVGDSATKFTYAAWLNAIQVNRNTLRKEYME